MNWTAVARKDFRDATRSDALLAVTVLSVLSMVAVSTGFVVVERRPTFDALLVFLGTLTQWLVPVAALVVAQGSVVGEQRDGTVKVLLGLPLSRRDVLLGKFVGRATAVTLAVLAGFAVNAGVVVVLYDAVDPTTYLAFAASTVLLGVAFTGVAVGVSATTTSPVRAVALVVGAFVAFLFVWDLVPVAVHVAVEGSVPGNRHLPAWFYLVQRLNPKNAYQALLVDLFPALMPRAPAGPAYLSRTATVGILLGWVAVPLVAGYYRFRRVDVA